MGGTQALGVVGSCQAALRRSVLLCLVFQRRNRSEDGRESFLEKRAPITSPACAVLTVIAY